MCMLFNNQSLYLSTHATTQFMAHFKSSFPYSSITVKTHLLEDHTVQQSRVTGVGFGLLGEQGAESIFI